MTWNLVQTTSGGIVSGSPLATPQAFAFANPNQAGNLLVLRSMMQGQFGVGAPITTGVTDTTGNTWQSPRAATNQDMTNGFASQTWYAFNSIAGPNTPSLAFNQGITFITGNQSSGTSTTFSASVTPTAVGQLIMVWCGTLSGTAVTMTVSDNQGNSYTQQIGYSTTSGSLYLWTAFAVNTSATTYTVTVSSSVACASFAVIYSGVSTNGPLDINQGGPTVGVGTSAAPAAPGVLTSGFGQWAVTGMITAGGTITDPSGYTNRETSTTVSGQSSDSNAIGIGNTQTPTWALSGSNQWIAFNLQLVGQAPAVTNMFWELSEWENSGGAITVDPFDGAGWSMSEFGSIQVPPQMLVPVSGSGDLVMIMALVNNSSGVLGQIGGINTTQQSSLDGGNILSQYIVNAPWQTPGFPPGLLPCTFGQPERQWTGAAIAFRFGGNLNTSKLPTLVNNASSGIYVAATMNVRMQLACIAGDLIAVSINGSGLVNSVTDSAGNSYQLSSGVFPNYIYHAYNIAAYGPGNVVSVAFAFSSSDYVDVLEYENIVSTSNPFDQGSSVNNPTGSTSGATPSVTTLFPNELILAMWTNGAAFIPQVAGGSTTWNYIFNIRDAASNNAQNEVDYVLGQPGPIQSSAGFLGTTPFGASIATFKGKALFISSQPTSQTVAVGATATFSVTAIASAGSLTYQWQLNGSNIGGATSSSYTTGVLGVGANGTYTCVVTDTYGSTTSQPAYLYVTASPGGGLGIPAIAQVANEEIPASGAAPTSNVVFDSMNF